jgi:hypothetical protein
MRMGDIGDPAELEAKIERTPAQEGEAQIVIGVVAPGAGVDLGPAKKALMLEGVNRHARARQNSFPSARPVRRGADIDPERIGPRRPPGIEAEAAVSGDHDTHIVPHRSEGARQGAHHIGEATHFDERIQFR